jgi:hypothetical protein
VKSLGKNLGWKIIKTKNKEAKANLKTFNSAENLLPNKEGIKFCKTVDLF